jgi:hypothetical protein
MIGIPGFEKPKGMPLLVYNQAADPLAWPNIN